jgi:hypothetical protein
MATTRLTVDLDQYVPEDTADEIRAELHSYVWGFIQNKYESSLAENRGNVSARVHQHDASSGACRQCVILATDDKS